ncbi:MAG: hypothetical protein LCH41_08565 [Armatimonadetes bacterium]|nr:hypothetical protein [Armatimonadota bacterium]
MTDRELTRLLQSHYDGLACSQGEKGDASTGVVMTLALGSLCVWWLSALGGASVGAVAPGERELQQLAQEDDQSQRESRTWVI